MVIRKCEANLVARNVVFKVLFVKLESILKQRIVKPEGGYYGLKPKLCNKKVNKKRKEDM